MQKYFFSQQNTSLADKRKLRILFLVGKIIQICLDNPTISVRRYNHFYYPLTLLLCGIQSKDIRNWQNKKRPLHKKSYFIEIPEKNEGTVTEKYKRQSLTH